jgi:hypothetical protein
VTLPPAVRKAALTAHITASVGWVGSVVAFAALAVAGIVSTEEQYVRAAYLAMEVLGWGVLVPLAAATFVTGMVQSLGTSWGLIRHYWVLIKLVLTVAATTVLLLYTGTLTDLADAAAAPAVLGPSSPLPSASPVVHSAAALLVLFIAAVLSVYKPRGLTPHGWRRLHQPSAGTRPR